jgi:hypothetical protein
MKYSHELSAGVKSMIHRESGNVELQESFINPSGGSTLKIEEYDMEGNLLSESVQPFQSFTANMLRLMWGRFFGTTLTDTGKDFGGNDKDMSLGVESNIKVTTATDGLERLGLTLFSNAFTSTPETYTGTLTTGLTHKKTVVSTVSSDADEYYFTITKTIENTSGVSKTCTKLALMAQTNATGEISSDDNTIITIDDIPAEYQTFANGKRRVFTLRIASSKDFFVQNMMELLNSCSGQEGSLFGTTFNNDVYAIAIDSNNNVYAGGNFTSPASYIAKWNGSAWSALGSGCKNIVVAIAIDSNNNVYAGGYFTSPASYIAKWNGSAWSALGSGCNNLVYAIAIDSNNNVYAGGNFTSPASFIAKWNGSAWSALGSGCNNIVVAIAIDSNNNVYAGGNFTTAFDGTSNYIAKAQGNIFTKTNGAGSVNAIWNIKATGAPNDYASLDAAITADTYGILVGTGATENTYNLVSKIAHGTGSGQLEYSDTTKNQPDVTSNLTEMSIIRTFTNSSGAPITIREVGLFVKGNPDIIMIARKIVDITLAANEHVDIEVFFRTET